MARSRVRYSVSEAGTPAARSWAMKPANISAPTSRLALCIPHPSIPRKRESRVAGSCRLPWIPAFAGMTKRKAGVAKRKGDKEGSCLSLSSAVEEGQALEEVDVLLVLQERAVERRDHNLGVVRAKRGHRDLVGHQQLQPVDQLGGGGLLLEPGHLADLVEELEGLARELLADVRQMGGDDPVHG